MRNLLPGLAIAVLALAPTTAGAQQPTALPTRYDEDRFYVEPVTESGARLVLYTDTGGGLFLLSDAVERLGLPTKDETTALPVFKPTASIPAPAARGGRLPVMPAAQRPPFAADWDGMLGQQWFAGRTWTFDYPGKRLLLWPEKAAVAADASRRVPLGFKALEGGGTLAFPRIQVEVDGETLDLLFDTGAMTVLSDTALATLKDGRAAARGTSFITQSVFERWRKKHPTWRVIEAAEQRTGAAMIEVPRVTIAGRSVGPVWFTVRPDKNFHEFMSQFMDKRVEGAIGGNALRHFRITVSYPEAYAIFE